MLGAAAVLAYHPRPRTLDKGHSSHGPYGCPAWGQSGTRVRLLRCGDGASAFQAADAAAQARSFRPARLSVLLDRHLGEGSYMEGCGELSADLEANLSVVN